MRKRALLVVPATLGLLAAAPAAAEVSPNPLFSDNMVLQQGKSVPVWGTARDGERVTVRFGTQTISTTARDGKWMVRLRPLAASSDPQRMTISGDNTLTLNNVLVGEVWICSGQSNMQWPVSLSHDPDSVAARSYDEIRLLTVPRVATNEPLSRVQVSWVEPDDKSIRDFSAVALHFGKTLQRELGVPIGLISTNFGGTPAEAWTRREILAREFPQILENQSRAEANYAAARVDYQLALSAHRRAVEEAKARGQQPPPAPRQPGDPGQSPQRPTGLYNAMIAPLVPYAIRGAIWYQGESNAGAAHQYHRLFPAMIRNWREDWGQGDFPFLFVQLAPFMQITRQPTESAWAELREAQLYTLRTVPNTGMAVITDVGDEKDIHPKAKEPVGYRLALSALGTVYGRNIVHSGPVYRSQSVAGDRIVLSFDHVGSGLSSQGGTLTGFTIAGPDRKWVDAQAEIRGGQVVVWSPQVKNPVAVRYGWANFPLGNLWNRDGLPATPFRTDDFPLTTAPKQ
ncbi:MAG: sialate O-acetylesterase [Armatimonadota bacterium]